MSLRWLSLATAVLAAPAGAFAAPDVLLTPAEQAWLRDHPTVRMMVDPEYQPADFLGADGTHQGIAADVLKLVSERTGLTFEVVNPPLARRLALDPAVRGADGVSLSAGSPEHASSTT